MALPREVSELKGSEVEPNKSSCFVLQRRKQAQLPGELGPTCPRAVLATLGVPWLR